MLSFLGGIDQTDVGGTRNIASMRAATLETKLLTERAEPREKFHEPLGRAALEVRPSSGLFRYIKMLHRVLFLYIMH